MSASQVQITSPTEILDPLAQKPEPPDRLFYATGILLDAEDFKAEQLYHRGRLSRALAYLHGGGTVAGLRVEWVKPLEPGEDAKFPRGRAEEIVVAPGIAVDRLGRVIESTGLSLHSPGALVRTAAGRRVVQGLSSRQAR